MKSQYRYKAVDEAGKNVTGVIEAEDQEAAMVALRMEFPTVKSVVNIGEKGKGLQMEIGGNSKIGDDVLALLCSQYSIILNSGAQLVACTELIANQTKDKSLKTILDGVVADVTAGRSLAASFEKYGGKRLPVTFYETIRAGEESGNLTKAFDTLKEYFQKSSGTAKSIKGALTYPLFVMVVGIVVVVVMMIKVIPVMTAQFTAMGGELPITTKILMGTSDFFVHHWGKLLAAIVILVLGYMAAYASDTGRLAIDQFKLKSPIMGAMRRTDCASQFSVVLGMLVSSGLPMVHALEILARTFDNYAYRDAVLAVGRDVENGKSLAGSMRRQEVFPSTLTEMIGTGEETGDLDGVLKTVGEYYTNEAALAAKAFVAKLEPTLLVFVAAFAGFIVISIYLPMFMMYDLY